MKYKTRQDKKQEILLLQEKVLALTALLSVKCELMYTSSSRTVLTIST